MTESDHEKNQVIRAVTQQLLQASVPSLAEAIAKLEDNYNPYHRVYYPFSLLFQKTTFPELGKNKLANCNSPHRKRIPELIIARGFKINLNQILDNGNYYMRPVDRLAKEAGYEGAFIEDHGISFTIPVEALTPKLQELIQDYEYTKKKYQLSLEEIQELDSPKAGYAWRQKTSEATFFRKVYPDEMVPINYLHKLRRDLSRYYTNLGFGRADQGQHKSCDLFYHKDKQMMILKIFKSH